MLVDVTLLRSNGLRLRPSELQPPTRGYLALDYASPNHNSFKRPVLTANLAMPQGGQKMLVSVLPPIFDVHLMPMKDWMFSLAGTELESINSDKGARVREHSQIWRCEVVLDAAVPPARRSIAVAVPNAPAGNRLIPHEEILARERAWRVARGFPPDCP